MSVQTWEVLRMDLHGAVLYEYSDAIPFDISV